MDDPRITRMERFGTLYPMELFVSGCLVCDNCQYTIETNEIEPVYGGGNTVFCCEECRDEYRRRDESWSF